MTPPKPASDTWLGGVKHGWKFLPALSETEAWKLTFHRAELHERFVLTGALVGFGGFEQTLLHAPAECGGTTFRGADFTRAQFTEARFRNADFDGPVTFREAAFAGKADFGMTKFSGTACFLDVNAADLNLTWEQIGRRLQSESAGEFEEARREYGLLKTIFERRNEYDDMDRAYRMLKRCERKSVPYDIRRPYRYLLKPLNALFLDLGSGYGTLPLNVGVSTLVTIVWFAVVYALFGDQILLGG